MTSLEDRLRTHFADRSTREPLPGLDAEPSPDRAGAACLPQGDQPRGVIPQLRRHRVLLAAAAVVVLALSAGSIAIDDDPALVSTDDTPTPTAPRDSPGNLPGSVAEVRLGSLEGGDDRALGALLGGTPVVINFFASWCAPCIDEMPAFERVHQSLGGQVAFIGMANRDAPEDALATVQSTGVTYPTFDDPDASAITFFGGPSMPTTVFIDASGQVVDVHSGALTEAELRSKVSDLFGVAEPMTSGRHAAVDVSRPSLRSRRRESV